MKREAALRELRRLLGPEAAGIPGGRLPACDFGGWPLSGALAEAAPASQAQVVALVRWAAKRAVALVPAGARSSFWGSSASRGAVLVDLRRMNRLLGLDEVERSVRVEAGIATAALEERLRRRGLAMAACPDGFGDATLGSMVANDTTAGYGMFAGPASAHLVGLRVVLGTGEVLRAGASSLYRGLPAFSRSGLPDFSGLFLASEGALGIVTEMTLRIKPLSPRRVLILRYAPSRAAFEGLARLARDLRSARICAHWVNVSRLSPEEDETRIELEGELGPEELERRCAWLAARLRRLGLPGPERTENEPARWFGGERPRRWTGVSVSAPYGNISRIQSLWLKRWRPRARRLTEGEAGLRTYFGLEGTAALLWWRRREGLERESARFEAAARRDLARLGLPYRLGRAWGEAAKARLDPAYRRRLRWLKRCFDPKGIMNPGVGAF